MKNEVAKVTPAILTKLLLVAHEDVRSLTQKIFITSLGAFGDLSQVSLAGNEVVIISVTFPGGDLVEIVGYGVAIFFVLNIRPLHGDCRNDIALAIIIEDGEVFRQVDHCGMTAQDVRADRVEVSNTDLASAMIAEHACEALLHLARSLPSEGDGQNFGWLSKPALDDVGDAIGKNCRLAGAGTSHDDQWTFGCFSGEALLLVQAAQKVTLSRRGAKGTVNDVGIEHIVHIVFQFCYETGIRVGLIKRPTRSGVL